MKIRTTSNLTTISLGILIFTISFSLTTSEAFAATIDFNSLLKGQIIDNEFFISDGVTISAINADSPHDGDPHDGPDIAASFDSNMETGGDDDLVGFHGGDPNGWDGGNLDVLGDASLEEDLKKIMVLEENDFGDGFFVTPPDAPDDERGQPAGSIFLASENCWNSFGWDMIDIEPPQETAMGSGYIAFYSDNLFVNEIARVQFEHLDGGSPGIFADATVIFGNDHANRINPITAAELTIHTGDPIMGFKGIEFNLGGSGAFDNLVFEMCMVGGSGFDIDTTALLLAGAQMNAAWLIPVIVSAIGIGIVIARKL